MKLQSVRLSNFQCFGPSPTELNLEKLTFFIGPNGAGKTAAMQALCRLFAFDPTLKRIQKGDFHVPNDESEKPNERNLWIEADFLFPELLVDSGEHSTIPPHFGHMRLDEPDGIPRVRFRKTASIGVDGDIEEELLYVLDINDDGSPLSTAVVSRADRSYIQLHYLPARRDPADHIALSSNALLGRILRAVNWGDQREEINDLTVGISETLSGNASVKSVSEKLQSTWSELHKGTYFSAPSITFSASEIEGLLRHLSISFSPGHEEQLVDFSRLSDGQKSILYLSLVLSSQAIGRSAISGDDDAFDLEKLKPAIFTIVAVEEPENSLSPHYLGRIVSVLSGLVGEGDDAQALIATHAPSMLRRVAPECIRYFRLAENRETQVREIEIPPEADVAHKFVREAIQAFPELYFSRLVVLGEGDSEEIVLPRILKAKGVPIDESAVSIVPLGGRHVNHFWRLLNALNIPHITLLDMDLARYQGGWGRYKYVNDQLEKYAPEKKLPPDHGIPEWNDVAQKVLDFDNYTEAFEERGIFFSSPLDLDFSMLMRFSSAYEIDAADKTLPEESTVKAVLGKSHEGFDQYEKAEKLLFNTYHKRFKLGSKPAAHLEALSRLTDDELLANMPPTLGRLADAVIKELAVSPE